MMPIRNRDAKQGQNEFPMVAGDAISDKKCVFSRTIGGN